MVAIQDNFKQEETSSGGIYEKELVWVAEENDDEIPRQYVLLSTVEVCEKKVPTRPCHNIFHGKSNTYYIWKELSKYLSQAKLTSSWNGIYPPTPPTPFTHRVNDVVHHKMPPFSTSHII